MRQGKKLADNDVLEGEVTDEEDAGESSRTSSGNSNKKMPLCRELSDLIAVSRVQCADFVVQQRKCAIAAVLASSPISRRATSSCTPLRVVRSEEGALAKAFDSNSTRIATRNATLSTASSFFLSFASFSPVFFFWLRGRALRLLLLVAHLELVDHLGVR